MQRPYVMFYCQHVLGIGHLVRSLEIARALREEFQALLALGGPAVDGLAFPAGVEILHLPPLAHGEDSKADLTTEGGDVAREVKERRRNLLLEAFARTSPRC
ncbi:MAG TPA: hypothetical protein VMX16_14960 [Terriglobia bacterium]|nr:hypothetical protein [Terriglobia bacterium]